MAGNDAGVWRYKLIATVGNFANEEQGKSFNFLMIQKLSNTFY